MKTYIEQKKLSDSLKLLDGVARLTLGSDPQKTAEIKRIYAEAKKREENL